MLQARRARREEPLERHMPEPILSREDAIEPEQEALLADSVRVAFLVVLETLTPAERLAFVLHDMFHQPFDEMAPIVGPSPTVISGVRVRLSTRLSLPGVRGTSTRCSRCSTGRRAAPRPRRSRGAPTLVRRARAVAERRSPSLSGPRGRERRSSTARPGSSRTGVRSRSWG
jgi:hypothetical protein